jgi:hypothetical protein
MTERSFYWDGLSVGDATLAPYTTNIWNVLIWKVLFQKDESVQSVIQDYLGELAVSGISGGVQVATGAALVNGTFYENTTALTLNITIPSSNPRIDRIVLRKTWADEEIRLAVLKGAEAASPTAPSLTQTEDDIWEVSLAIVFITTAGVITVTDEHKSSVSPLAPLGAWQEIETISATGFETIIDFIDIPASYKSLIIIGSLRGSIAGTEARVSLNGDNTEANYRRMTIGVTSATTIASLGDAINGRARILALRASPLNDFNTHLYMELHDYALDTKFTTFMQNEVGIDNNTPNDNILSWEHNQWKNTAIVNRISLILSSGVFVTGTKITLYGRL